MRTLLFVLLLCATWQSYAVEVAGVKVDDTVQLGNSKLVLNGAGLRIKFFAKVYVAALYLGEKTSSEEAVLAGTGANRIALHMVRDVSGKLFSNGLNTSILLNLSDAETAALDKKVDQLLQFISTIPELKKGEILYLDYIPGLGTKIIIDGVEKGVIEGIDFNRALLKIWLGRKPVQITLKKELLGDE